MFDISAHIPSNTGWLQAHLPDEHLNVLWSYVEKAKEENISVKGKLAGQISSSLKLVDEDNYFFENVIEPFLNLYHLTFEDFGNGVGTTERHDYCLNAFWVNFQNKHEFNPIHAHTFSIYSFVIWLNIPTDWREEHRLPLSINAGEQRVSNFEFVYTDMLGRIKTYPFWLDGTCNGKMLFFPSQLNHLVYPFYDSDDERISISGNIALNTSCVAQNS